KSVCHISSPESLSSAKTLLCMSCKYTTLSRMTAFAVIPLKFPLTVIGTVHAMSSESRLPALMDEFSAARVDWRLPCATGQSCACSRTSRGTGLALSTIGVAGLVPVCGSAIQDFVARMAAADAAPATYRNRRQDVDVARKDGPSGISPRDSDIPV